MGNGMARLLHKLRWHIKKGGRVGTSAFRFRQGALTGGFFDTRICRDRVHGRYLRRRNSRGGGFRNTSRVSIFWHHKHMSLPHLVTVLSPQHRYLYTGRHGHGTLASKNVLKRRWSRVRRNRPFLSLWYGMRGSAER